MKRIKKIVSVAFQQAKEKPVTEAEFRRALDNFSSATLLIKLAKRIATQDEITRIAKEVALYILERRINKRKKN